MYNFWSVQVIFLEFILSHWFVLSFSDLHKPNTQKKFSGMNLYLYYDSYVDTQYNPVDTEVTLCYLLHIFLNT